ncbi:hypothetical protein ACGFIF_43105 [Kribbella sp. NPDC049174]|uniref:hypothetical protein n=1 Tax=Kribbella sp. NPDC049174 TaxID=3364112 RepID=UPI0037152FCC
MKEPARTDHVRQLLKQLPDVVTVDYIDRRTTYPGAPATARMLPVGLSWSESAYGPIQLVGWVPIGDGRQRLIHIPLSALRSITR